MTWGLKCYICSKASNQKWNLRSQVYLPKVEVHFRLGMLSGAALVAFLYQLDGEVHVHYEWLEAHYIAQFDRMLHFGTMDFPEDCQRMDDGQHQSSTMPMLRVSAIFVEHNLLKEVGQKRHHHRRTVIRDSSAPWDRHDGMEACHTSSHTRQLPVTTCRFSHCTRGWNAVAQEQCTLPYLCTRAGMVLPCELLPMSWLYQNHSAEHGAIVRQACVPTIHWRASDLDAEYPGDEDVASLEECQPTTARPANAEAMIWRRFLVYCLPI
jgi:hypothetical protein